MISAIMNITLTADSEMVFDANNSVSADKIISNGSVWDLGNHTLTIVFQGNDPDIWFGSNGNKTNMGSPRTAKSPAGTTRNIPLG